MLDTGKSSAQVLVQRHGTDVLFPVLSPQPMLVGEQHLGEG